MSCDYSYLMVKKDNREHPEHGLTIFSPAGRSVLPRENFVAERDKDGKILAWIFKP